MAATSDFDPDAVPIQPAATVMIVDDRPDLQVLMIQRNANMVFAGGMWVFPGGRVDPDDADDFERHCIGLDDDSASTHLGIDDGGLAFWVAAIRENYEEAGLLLGRRHDDAPFDLPLMQQYRAELNDGERSFLSIVQDTGMLLDTSAVHYIAHWITPVGSPRRYSARFFVTSPPDGQDVTHDESETVDWSWVSPREALAQYARDEMVMMTPTVRMLRSLALFDSADDVLAAARANQSDERVRVRTSAEDGDVELVMPGEPGYDDADQEKENGWIRLRPL